MVAQENPSKSVIDDGSIYITISQLCHKLSSTTMCIWVDFNCEISMLIFLDYLEEKDVKN